MNILLKDGRLIDPAAGRDETTDLLITDGKIERIGENLRAPSAQTIELRGKVVTPGLMDMHVHLREPGFEYKETIQTGCAAAAAGGFTGVCCMPNTQPPIDDEAVVRLVQAKAKLALNGIVDVYPAGTVTLGRKGEQLAPMAELAGAGAVAFTDDGSAVHDTEIMRRALEYAAMYQRPVIQHAQDPALTRGGAMNEGSVATALGLAGMPDIAEDVMIARDLQLVKYTGGRYHVAHISTAGAVQLVREAKAHGLNVTCEVTPHHFTLTEDSVRSYDTNTKMNPPLRSANDVEAVKTGLQDGTIDAIASDHAPHSFDEKQVEYQAAPFGIVGLETTLALALAALVQKNILTLPQLIAKLSTNPRRILRLPDIRIAPGEMANLTVIDPSAEWVVDPSALRSLSKNTPFGGRRLKGKAIGIINNGQAFWA